MSSSLYALQDDLANSVSIIEQYSTDLHLAESRIKIKGKRIDVCNVEQASWLGFYDEKRVELYTIVKWLEMETERVRGVLWKKYTENYSRELSFKDKEQYINGEGRYISFRTLYLEFKEVYDKYESVVEAFKARGYALNNLTRLYVATMQEVML